jgi:hypothetical protein
MNQKAAETAVKAAALATAVAEEKTVGEGSAATWALTVSAITGADNGGGKQQSTKKQQNGGPCGGNGGSHDRCNGASRNCGNGCGRD